MARVLGANLALCWMQGLQNIADATAVPIAVFLEESRRPGRPDPELSNNCSIGWCTSPSGHFGKHDCWAGTRRQPCTCSQGVAVETGSILYIKSLGVYHEYRCCMEYSGPAYAGEECGAYVSSSNLKLQMFAAGALCGVVGLFCCMAPVARRHRLPCREVRMHNKIDIALNEAPQRDGENLHKNVKPESWCITKEDLRHLRYIVEEHLEKGLIVPSSIDEFDTEDREIGPSVYTVTKQLIKPVTAAAGNSSWALMLHPDGLACDIFVTHSWNEGIFEFIDKVLHSWPRDARSAYCCMLSNPQNLDLGGLLSKPRDSPFARALESAKYMMVVPNSTTSIYTRIWCTYEAYLAYALDKVIFIASTPIDGLVPSLLTQLSHMFAGMLCSCWAVMAWDDETPGSWDYESPVFLSLCERSLFVGSLAIYVLTRAHHVQLRLVLCRFIAQAAGWNLFNFFNFAYLNNRFTIMTTYSCLIANFLAYVLFPPALEYDRLIGIGKAKEAMQLRRGYSGKVRDASCSVPEDGDHIRREIFASGVEEAVDFCIDALLTAGISTPYLRATVEITGELKDADQWSFSAIAFALIFFQTPFLMDLMNSLECQVERHGRSSIAHCYSHTSFTAKVASLEGIMWLCLFLLLRYDMKSFAAASTRLMLIPYMFIIWNIVFPGEWTVGNFITAYVVGPMVLVLSLVGPLGIARVPIIGPWIVRWSLGVQPWQFWRAYAPLACNDLGEKSASEYKGDTSEVESQSSA